MQEQIDLLLRYKKEYLSKLNFKVSQGILGCELKNYDYFITSLIHSINNQTKVIQKYENQYQKYFVLWRDNQYKLKLWNIISSKLSDYHFKIEQLEEQRQLDECVQKSFSKNR
ncbi:MAG: flagellar FliJ family protein [Buchnera aphidicola (Schlechtendalia peitan)]